MKLDDELAVAHRLADMKIAYNKARATLVYTTALAQSGAATPGSCRDPELLELADRRVRPALLVLARATLRLPPHTPQPPGCRQ